MVLLFGIGSFLVTAFSYVLGVIGIAKAWPEISNMLGDFFSFLG